MLTSRLKWSVFEVDVPIFILGGCNTIWLPVYTPIDIRQEYVEVKSISLQGDSIAVHRQLVLRHIYNARAKRLQEQSKVRSKI